MVSSAVGLLILLGLLTSGYIIKRKNFHGKFMFRIGYLLYTRTRLGYYYHRRVIAKSTGRGFHSKLKTVPIGGDIAIHIVPILDDNYCYIVVNTSTRVGVAIDPADPISVQRFIVEKGIDLKAILTTHKHWDHAGGNVHLEKEYPHVLIYGSKKDGASAVNRFVNDEDSIKIGGMEFTVKATPGHTIGHVVYMLTSTNQPCLFSGDHLFSGGCGRVFEGSYEAMLASLELVKSLEPSTLIFPGHEYTFKNFQFALSIEPTNSDLERKLDEVRALRIRKESTVPSTLSDEMKFNPFLKTHTVAMHTVTGVTSDVSVLQSLREMKNNF